MPYIGNVYHPDTGDSVDTWNTGLEGNAVIINANETALPTKADATATQTALDDRYTKAESDVHNTLDQIVANGDRTNRTIVLKKIEGAILTTANKQVINTDGSTIYFGNTDLARVLLEAPYIELVASRPTPLPRELIQAQYAVRTNSPTTTQTASENALAGDQGLLSIGGLGEAHTDGAVGTVTFRKFANGICSLTGSYDASLGSFVMPEGCRPLTLVRTPVLDQNSSVHTLVMSSTGAVTTTATTTTIYLEGVFYFAG